MSGLTALTHLIALPGDAAACPVYVHAIRNMLMKVLEVVKGIRMSQTTGWLSSDRDLLDTLAHRLYHHSLQAPLHVFMRIRDH